MPHSGLPNCECGRHRHEGWILIKDLSPLGALHKKRIRCVGCGAEKITNAGYALYGLVDLNRHGYKVVRVRDTEKFKGESVPTLVTMKSPRWGQQLWVMVSSTRKIHVCVVSERPINKCSTCYRPLTNSGNRYHRISFSKMRDMV